MKHARDDYNRIQDPDNLIPENEPVFLLRAQDKTAPATLEAWANMVALLGGDPEIIKAARLQAHKMREWQIINGSKVPDLPKIQN